ncbi:MAG: hypothetical protein JSU81_01005 [Candidatus Coatesbacteria bacterium]|nr:MAG: hypothetical protein JSU81_01005 [Candidatus Coatesbacteria bacterium]
MRRRLTVVSAAAVAAVGVSCVNLRDVVCPLEVAAGGKFEVRLVGRVAALPAADAAGEYYGVLAVAAPADMDIREAKYDGVYSGKLAAVDEYVPPPGEAEAGEWRYLVTRRPFAAVEWADAPCEATIKFKAGRTPGEYRLAFAAGAAPAAEGGPDLSRLEWGRADGEPLIARGVTVK